MVRSFFFHSLALREQFNMAKQIPGKEEFHETIRYFSVMLKKHNIDVCRSSFHSSDAQVRLNHAVTADELKTGGYDDIILATGVVARNPSIEGIKHPKVLSYIDVLKSKVAVGQRVAVIGAGLLLCVYDCF